MKKLVLALLVSVIVLVSVTPASALVRYAPKPTDSQRTHVIRRHYVHIRRDDVTRPYWMHDRFGMPYQIIVH